MPVDTNTCTTAPGYKFGSDGDYETFDGRTTPAGWTVVDNKGNGQVWQFTDPGNRGNLTGGSRQVRDHRQRRVRRRRHARTPRWSARWST